MSDMQPHPSIVPLGNRPLRRWLASISAYVFLLIITFTLSPNYRWPQAEVDQPYGADFLQEWIGARMIATGHGGDLYKTDVFRAWQHDPDVVGFVWDHDRFFPPVYPPWHYAMFVPLALLPYRWAVMVWVSILWGMVFLGGRMIADIARRDQSGDHSPRGIRGVAMAYPWLLVVLFPAVPVAVMFGQKSLIWLVILGWMCRLLQERRTGSAGMLFALMSLKPTLFYLIPCFMARHRQWRFLAGCALGASMLWGLSLAILPWPIWRGYAETVLRSAQYGTQGGYRMDWSCSLWSIANSVPTSWQPWVKGFVCLPLAAVVLITVLRAGNWAVCPRSLFLVLTATLLLAPHAYHYDSCIVLVGLGWMVTRNPSFAAATYAGLIFAVAWSSSQPAYVAFPFMAFALAASFLVWSMPMPDALRSTPDSEHVPGGETKPIDSHEFGIATRG